MHLHSRHARAFACMLAMLGAATPAHTATVLEQGFDAASLGPVFVDEVVLDGAATATATESTVRRRGLHSVRIDRSAGELRSYLGYYLAATPTLNLRAAVRVAAGLDAATGLELMGIIGSDPAVPLAAVVLESDGTLAVVFDDGAGSLSTLQPTPDDLFPSDHWVELELRYTSGSPTELHRDGVRVFASTPVGAAGSALSAHLGQRSGWADLSQAAGTIYFDILHADDADPVGMEPDRPALVLVDRADGAAYADYASERVRGSLDHFGLAYREVDLASETVNGTLLAPIDLLVIGQEGLGGSLSLAEQQAVADAVSTGMGLVGFDPYADAYGSPAFQALLGGPSYDGSPATTTTFAAAAPGTHFVLTEQPIVALDRSYVWAAATPYRAVTNEGSATVLASTTGGDPLLVARAHVEGRVLWWFVSTELWDNALVQPDEVSHSFLGHLHGIDDLLWRGLVWAHRKPMIWFPLPEKLTALKIDDVKGRALDGIDALDYADAAASTLGVPIHLSVFLDDIDLLPARRAALLQLQATHGVEVSAHAYTGGDTNPSEPETSFLFWDAEHDEPFSGGELDTRWADIDDFFAGTSRGSTLAQSSWLAPHQSQAGDGNETRASSRGVNLANMIVDLGTTAGTGSQAWKTPAPFGSGCHALAPLGSSGELFNVSSYADCLFWDFDFLVQRNLLVPVTTPAEAIQNALFQARRAHAARFPMLFVPHEYVLTGNAGQVFPGTGFDLADWTTVISGIRDGLASDAQVRWLAPEALGSRVRDHARTRILSVTRDRDAFEVLLEGEIQTPTSLETWSRTDLRGQVSVPAFDGTWRHLPVVNSCSSIGGPGAGPALGLVALLLAARRRRHMREPGTSE